MSDSDSKQKYLDPQQVIFLPFWARISFLVLIGFLALSTCICGVVFLFYPEYRNHVVPMMSIAQTAAGAFAIVLFVLFAEKQISTPRLHQKTDEFLASHVMESLSRIEIPQINKNRTVQVRLLTRGDGIHGHKKDIYGANYEISLDDFKMKLWVGINVKRLIVIYFVNTHESMATENIKDIFKFTFGGAEKVGYQTNFERTKYDDEHIISIWSTVFADSAILGNPVEQLFWVQDLAMMTQSVARTAIRNGINLHTTADPGPL